MSKISAFYATLMQTASLEITFQDAALAKALAEREAQKAAAAGEALLKLFDETANYREELITRRRDLREALNKSQAQIKAFMRCVDYANVEGNCIPLAFAVGEGKSPSAPLDYSRLQDMAPSERTDHFALRYALQNGRAGRYLPPDVVKALLDMSKEDLLKISFVPEGWTPPQSLAIADPSLTV